MNMSTKYAALTGLGFVLVLAGFVAYSIPKNGESVVGYSARWG